MLKEGVILGERYEIISRIGSGGMADVYKAKDHKLNRMVAVKVLKPEFREDKTFIRKFRTEAQAAAGLSHPNIVNVYDVGEDRGVYYIVMELVEGITLKDYIDRKGKLSVKEATSIAIQVSLGLEAAQTAEHHHFHRRKSKTFRLWYCKGNFFQYDQFERYGKRTLQLSGAGARRIFGL